MTDFMNSDSILNFTSFWNGFEERLESSEWIFRKNESSVTFFLIDCNSVPHIRVFFKVLDNLELQIFFKEKIINLNSFGVGHFGQHWSSFENILSRLNAMTPNHYKEFLCSNNLNIIKDSIEILENILDSYEENSPKRKTLWFIVEQLKLLTSTQIRYSNEMLIVAFSLYTGSPHLFRNMGKYGLFTLPHPKYLQKLVASCNLISMKPCSLIRIIIVVH